MKAPEIRKVLKDLRSQAALGRRLTDTEHSRRGQGTWAQTMAIFLGNSLGDFGKSFLLLGPLSHLEKSRAGLRGSVWVVPCGAEHGRNYSQTSWARVVASSGLAVCVMYKWLNLRMPRFPHLENGDSQST